MRKVKVLVIGLDAACLDIILPWVTQEHLPHLKKLLNNGFYSKLRSTIPPWTAPAWVSLITGKNPGKHGIFDFFKRKDNHELELVSSFDNKAKAIWDYLSEAGKSTIAINVPITHPARKINGIIIPGYLAPENPRCYPPDILKEVKRVLGEYKIYSKYEIQQVSPKKKLQGYIEVTKLRKDTAIYLGKKYDWDFLMVQFQKTDAVFHDFKDEKYILRFYKFIDYCIGEIVEELGTEANIFLVSDHGIGKCDWTFYINSWLRRKGLLKTEGIKPETNSLDAEKRRFMSGRGLPRKYDLFGKFMGYLSKMGISAELIDSWISLLHLDFLRSLVSHSLIQKISRIAIDKANSIAYCTSISSLGIRINSQTKKEYQKLKSHLIEELKVLKDPEGKPVFEAVLPREEYYHGPNIADAPDIVFVPREMNYTIGGLLSNKLFSPYEKYNHKMNGLFVGVGEDIRSEAHPSSTLSIFDVTPTILHVLGVPIPTDMNGRTLKEIFRKDSWLAQKEIKYEEVETKRIRRKIRDLKRPGKI